MRRDPLPFQLEDRTGAYIETDFDDIYDRRFYRLSRPNPQRPASLTIFEMAHRASKRRDSFPFKGNPMVALDFTQEGGLGTISYQLPQGTLSMAMSKYLQKTHFFGGYVQSVRCDLTGWG
jgi:hypothetical protein